MEVYWISMADYMTVRDASLAWGISEKRIALLCRDGRIPGAFKNKSWFLPKDADKPSDKRIKSTSIPDMHLLPLPLGVSDFESLVKEYYYVDKTLLIKEFLDEKVKVSLFTRPRRFGKTLNMNMLKTFFEISEKDNSVLFADKQIWSCGEEYRRYQGKYPVIFITFKDIKHMTWQDSLKNIESILATEFLRHKELLSSDKTNKFDKDYYEKIISQQASEVDLMQALLVLSRMLDDHYGIAPVIIIDEYDTPIQQGYSAGFYDNVVLFMRNFFSGGLKDNVHLSFGFMTGILRVAKESIFSGLNNLKINSIMDNKYSEYFGFTQDEVKKMATYYKAAGKYNEICEWYDGYRFGNTDIFNPWSVSYYFANEMNPKAFWLSTGSNEIIGEALKYINSDIYEKLQVLLQGKNITTYIDTDVIYPQIKNKPSSIFSFLLVAGYLKCVRTEVVFNGDYMCELAIPNREIGYVYNKEILERMEMLIPSSSAIDIQLALYKGNANDLKKAIEKLLRHSVSYYDTAKENFYHGFVLGLCAVMDNRYEVKSNRESGDGRFDICMIPRIAGLPGIVIELKASEKEQKLGELAREALKQIETKSYDTMLKEAKVEVILKYGVAFCGKNVEICTLL